MEMALGDKTQGATPGSLQKSNTSDFAEDILSLRTKDELETIPVEETQALKPEDLQESAPAEATRDMKPETGQVQHRLKVWAVFMDTVMHLLAIINLQFSQ